MLWVASSEKGNFFVFFYYTPEWQNRSILIGCKTRSFSNFRNLMLLIGIPTQIPQSDAITSWMKHAAFLHFQDSFKLFSSPNTLHTLTAFLHFPDSLKALAHYNWNCKKSSYRPYTLQLFSTTAMIFSTVLYKASKTETLDLCQLPRPLFEIHKMINLPASVKIFKNKLKNWEAD